MFLSDMRDNNHRLSNCIIHFPVSLKVLVESEGCWFESTYICVISMWINLSENCHFAFNKNVYNIYVSYTIYARYKSLVFKQK